MSASIFKATKLIAEREIQKMIEQGAFNNLPGAGKPIPDLDEAYDENWWLKKYLKRENIGAKELKLNS